MQWLFDLVAQQVIDTIGVPPCFVWRGNFDSTDYNAASMTFDNNWHTLDFSSIAPAGAKALNLYTSVYSDFVGFSCRFRCRRAGATHNQDTCILRPQVAGIWFCGCFFVACNDNREVEYTFDNAVNPDAKVTCRGWIL